MSQQLNTLHRILSEGYELDKITYRKTRSSFDIILEFARGSASHVAYFKYEPALFEHLQHYRRFPSSKTRKMKLQYVEDIGKYEEMEQKVAEFLCGKNPYLTVASYTDQIDSKDRKRIESAVGTWTKSESVVHDHTTGKSRLFYDILVLRKSDDSIECNILEKEKLTMSEIHSTMEDASQTDWTKCYTSILLSPKATKDFNRDAMLVTMQYDAKTRRIDRAVVGTLRSIFNYIGRGKHFAEGFELAGVTALLNQKMFSSTTASVYVVAPFRDSEYTPVPWLTYLLLGQLPCNFSSVEQKLAIRPYESLFFGYPGSFRQRDTLAFKRKGQSAYVKLEIENHYYEIRFDRIPKFGFHVHYIIGKDGEKLADVLNHYPVLLRDIWDASENLSIAFLGACAYDVRFGDLATKDIRDFDDAIKQEPLAGYPLVVLSMVEEAEMWLRENPREMALLKRIWENKKYVSSQNETKLIHTLEKKGLMTEGGLTALASMVIARSVGLE